MVASSLIRLASGQLSYITSRVDRSANGQKIHMLDMFQITEASDKYKSSMERLGKAIKDYSANTILDIVNFFDLTLFSFITGNNDMHLKNFSMIERPLGWLLSPAYDLLNVSILIPDPQEELALTLAGKKNKLKREHFEQFGEGLDLTDKQVKSAFKRVEKNQTSANDWIQKSFLPNEMKTSYHKLLEKRYKQLGL